MKCLQETATRKCFLDQFYICCTQYKDTAMVMFLDAGAIMPVQKEATKKTTTSGGFTWDRYRNTVLFIFLERIN